MHLKEAKRSRSYIYPKLSDICALRGYSCCSSYLALVPSAAIFFELMQIGALSPRWARECDLARENSLKLAEI